MVDMQTACHREKRGFRVSLRKASRSNVLLAVAASGFKDRGVFSSSALLSMQAAIGRPFLTKLSHDSAGQIQKTKKSPSGGLTDPRWGISPNAE
jgi:hypothetical protein